MMLGTMGTTTPQVATRQFTAGAGTKSVTVRYRMQTDEIRPNGFANDSFVIRIDNLTAGTAVQDSQTVGSLLTQFDANSATPWYSRELAASEGNTIRVTITVQNAVDNAYVSYVYADFVQEQAYQVPQFVLNDMISPSDPWATAREDKALRFLSASTYASYEGYVRVHGYFRITGPPSDSVQSMTLAVYNSAGSLLARGDLARASVSNIRTQVLGVPFGQDGLKVGLNAQNQELPITPLLFELSSASLNAASQNAEEELLAVLEVRTTLGRSFVRELRRPLTKVVRYQGTNRFGAARDETDCSGLRSSASRARNRPPFPCGRDDWARPKTVWWASTVGGGVDWNDFSNLNGGFFPIHSGHRDGDTIDGRTPHYLDLDATAAQEVIAFINQHSGTNQQIIRVLVGYSISNCPVDKNSQDPNSPNSCTDQQGRSACGYVDERSVRLNANPFYNAIRNVTLADGRPATDVIRNTTGHCDHFDVQLNLNRIQIPQ